MRNNLLHRRIPTIAALAILLVAIGVTSFLINQGVFLVGRASPDKEPQNIEIADITDTSFTVSFTTNEPTTGVVSVSGGDELASLVLDNRDKESGQPKEYYSHYITVPNLTPETTYTFTIIADDSEVAEGDIPFEVTTGLAISENPPEQKPLFGKILLPTGGAASDTLVYIDIDGAQNVSGLTNSSGEYLIPTNSIRNLALSEYFALETDSPISIRAVRQNMTSEVTILYKDAETIPAITLEQDYNFTDTDITETEPTTPSAELQIPEEGEELGALAILEPEKNASIVDIQPEIRGVATPNQNVLITIQPDNVIETVRAGGNGAWIFRPDEPLAQGAHTVSVESENTEGELKTVSQTFSILPVGSQVGDSATPSASLTPTRTPSPTIPTTTTITPTGLISRTPTPSSVATTSPTLTHTPTPTSFITPLVTHTPSPTIASPGGPGQTVVLTFVSLAFIFAGASLLFFL